MLALDEEMRSGKMPTLGARVNPNPALDEEDEAGPDADLEEDGEDVAFDEEDEVGSDADLEEEGEAG